MAKYPESDLGEVQEFTVHSTRTAEELLGGQAEPEEAFAEILQTSLRHLGPSPAHVEVEAFLLSLAENIDEELDHNAEYEVRYRVDPGLFSRVVTED